jgi:hypothetical protein
MYKGFIKNLKKGSLASTTASDVFVMEKPKPYSDLSGAGTDKGDVLSIATPKGGKTNLYTSATAGAIKIKLPVAMTNVANFSMQIHLFGQTYTGNAKDAAIIQLNGRTTSVIDTDYSATILTGDARYNLPVRFGNDGVNHCIWIGLTTYIFKYMSVGISNLFVTRVTTGSIEDWKGVFEISRVQAFGTVDVLLTDNFPAAKINKGTTALRPTTSIVAFQYFDTSLGVPIWWNGSAWVNSSGTAV